MNGIPRSLQDSNRHPLTTPWLAVSEEVADAITAGIPVLALESSVIAQGMPRPTNYEAAIELCDSVRKAGVIPAITCIIDGYARVGIDNNDLKRLAFTDGIRKVSTRDIPVVIASGGLGTTTVAATMRLAHEAGIRVFATGGIGGVHRGPFDVSADLMAFTREPVIVVSAGIKSILDLPTTVETLETLGVPLLGYRTNELPAFYSVESGIPVERADTAEEIIRRFAYQSRIIPSFGMLVTVPVPREYEIPKQEIDETIDRALRALEEEQKAGRHTGQGVTPYLLSKVNELTVGRSLEANVRLLYNNVMLGCELATAWSALGEQGDRT
jgi:pseudouridine-5'-phosphate glycosidase